MAKWLSDRLKQEGEEEAVTPPPLPLLTSPLTPLCIPFLQFLMEATHYLLFDINYFSSKLFCSFDKPPQKRI